MLDILTVAGARPNFIKVGALYHAFSRSLHIRPRLLHTGQHYDAAMSGVFFEELQMPHPDVYLGVGSGSHAQQTARVMIAFEEEVRRKRPDAVVVVGDVNSTLACALVCAKMHIPVAHVEAGLRSGDLTMPEEVNRIATDMMSDYLFVTEQSGIDNLRREGIPDGRVHFAGNVMIDSLVRFRQAADSRGILEDLGIARGKYILMTMHRPATVDDPEKLKTVVRLMERLSVRLPIVFPAHPRTRSQLEEAGLMKVLEELGAVKIIPPCGYLDFLHLMANTAIAITDSGGVQEETTFLGVPCVTLRPNTERPVTVTDGTNVLLPLDPDRVSEAAEKAISGKWKAGRVPPLWDGHAAERIARMLASRLAPPRRVHVPITVAAGA